MPPAKKATKSTTTPSTPTESSQKTPEPTKVEKTTTTNNVYPNRVKLFVGVPSQDLEVEVNQWIVSSGHNIVDIQTSSLGITNVWPNGCCVIAVTFRYDD